MEGKRWYETQDALLEIAQYAQDLNVRSVSMRFMNTDIYDRGIQVCFITLNGCGLTSHRVVMQLRRGLTALCQWVRNEIILYLLDLYFYRRNTNGDNIRRSA
jgi:hypothetical protein